MANKTYALTTRDRIKDILGITNNDQDDLISAFIYVVTDYIEKRCGRRFQQATHTQEIYDGETVTKAVREHLMLKNAPVTEGSISSFQFDNGTPSTPNWVDFGADDFKLDPDLGVIYMDTNLPEGKRNIRVTYEGGYAFDFTNSLEDTHELPLDITGACERMVVNLYKRRASEGKTSEGFEASTITWGSEVIDPLTNRIIQMYRRSEFIA